MISSESSYLCTSILDKGTLTCRKGLARTEMPGKGWINFEITIDVRTAAVVFCIHAKVYDRMKCHHDPITVTSTCKQTRYNLMFRWEHRIKRITLKYSILYHSIYNHNYPF